MIVYLLTAVNAIILGVVAYLFYAFRGALDSSGVKQIDDYLHELEGSVAQLTEQFERTSTRISKDLLRKTTELQALIGEADTKLAHANRLHAVPAAEAERPREPRRFDAERADELPIGEAEPAFATPAREQASYQPAPAPAGEGRLMVPAAGQAAQAPVASQSSMTATLQPADVTPMPQAVQAEARPPVPRRPSASELLATKPSLVMRQQAPRPVQAPPAPQQPQAQREPVAAAPEPAEFTPGLPAQVDARAVAAAAATQPNDKYRLIFLLASEGMDSASIAKHTNLTRGEVEMLLDLRRQGKI
jgi:hypothetical protein